MKNHYKSFLNDALNNDSYYITARNLVLKVCSPSSLWLIGSSVYGNIINRLYGTKKPPKDYDFIFDGNLDYSSIPDYLKTKLNHFGSLKMAGRDYEIDLVPLENVMFIVSKNLKPSIETFLSTTPLNIQSIAYDVIDDELMGEIGIDCIIQRLIFVNDPDSAKDDERIYGRPIEDLMKGKSLEYGFDYSV